MKVLVLSDDNKLAIVDVEINQPIQIVEGSFDETKVSDKYFTYFTGGLNKGPFFSDGIHIHQLIDSTFRFDGEITKVSVVSNSLRFERYNQTNLDYKPNIVSYVYSNTDIHSFIVDEEKFWTLTIPYASFGSNNNVLNVRIGSVDTNIGGHLRNSFVSTWELDNNNNLIVRVYMKNTLGQQLNVNNVSLIIQTI